jgi:hypothetical protein
LLICQSYFELLGERRVGEKLSYFPNLGEFIEFFKEFLGDVLLNIEDSLIDSLT